MEFKSVYFNKYRLNEKELTLGQIEYIKMILKDGFKADVVIYDPTLSSACTHIVGSTRIEFRQVTESV